MGKFWELYKLYRYLTKEENMNKVLGTSEFWVGLMTIVGQLFASMGIIPKDAWDHIIYPAIVYIVARLTSKAAKQITGTGGNQ